MPTIRTTPASLLTLAALLTAAAAPVRAVDPAAQSDDQRMAWWREARFGMFIHWGLYAIPAGEWKGATNHAEWIRHTAQIPVERYDQLVREFNPVKFDADQWTRFAKDAGMKYVVITSKHHDGFCLFDSAQTDYDIMSTPFQRDIMQELSDACRKHGLKICWYHSIMDWHHPDYLPRRPWEAADRPADGADFDRFRVYLKNQVRELLTNYGPIGVMWFDGEWEGAWTHEHGLDLYKFVRAIQPDVIVNNRVDKGRSGMAGMTSDARFAGDFGTPEQEIPATGLPGIDWETCMTMNDHWGYNQHDDNWKTTEDLIRKLADIASKGGNFLLNVGPQADGTFPQESIDRLREIGKWMKVNDESIHGTQASPFKSLPWGRCTQKLLPDGNATLYLHVFDWPKDGKLVVPGLENEPLSARLLADAGGKALKARRDEDAVVIDLPSDAPDPIDTVVALVVRGTPNVIEPPAITAARKMFIDKLDVEITPYRPNVEVRYTLDGTEPDPQDQRVVGPIAITETCTLTARQFRDGRPISGPARTTFTKVTPRPAEKLEDTQPGVRFEYYEGDWDRLPDFDALGPVKDGVVENFDFSPRNQSEHFAFRYRGFVTVPRAGVYTFYTLSDDGSRLYIGDRLVVDNDGLHSSLEANGDIALAAGPHPITVTFFEKTGGDALEVRWEGPGLEKQKIAMSALSCKP